LIDSGQISPANVKLKDSSGKAVLTSTVFDPTGWAIYDEPNGAHILTSGGTDVGTVTGQPTAVADTDCVPRKQIQWIATRLTGTPGGFGTYAVSPARQSQITGSLLTISYPEQATWDESAKSYLYPFIFESDSSWDVDVCTQLPVGYKIAGVYDENGNFVSTSSCSQAFVQTQPKVIAFDVLKTGSPPQWAFHAQLKARGPHSSKTLNLDIPSIVKSAEKKKGRADLKSKLCKNFKLLC